MQPSGELERESGTGGMQPSREREGKPGCEGEGESGGTVGMQPSAKAEGKSVGEGGGNTVGMQPSRKRDGKPGGEGKGGHSWDAAAGQGRRQTGWGGRREAREGRGSTLLGGRSLLLLRSGFPGLTILYWRG
jgi:hypothetical protein